MSRNLSLIALLTVGLLASAWLLARDRGTRDAADSKVQLLNVSYDVSRELWRDLNAAFVPKFEAETGRKLEILQSHGGSSSQARAVVDGQEADVVTLNMFTDTDLLRKQGLLASDWTGRLPNNSLPYVSTVVFVVRKGNPHGIRDWADLLKPGIEIITPNPKTSGLGKLSLLAAWASVVDRGGDDAEAKKFVRELFGRIPVLDTGGRSATVTFSQKGIGDVHLTFENEAYLEVNESQGELELVHPAVSILAEPFVAWVDANVKRHGTEQLAEEYLKFLYSDEGQEIVAGHYLRPSNPAVLSRHENRFPAVKLIPVTTLVGDWDAAIEKFFADGALYDQLSSPQTTAQQSN